MAYFLFGIVIGLNAGFLGAAWWLNAMREENEPDRTNVVDFRQRDNDAA
jgi:hypothetical protein